MCNRYAWHYVYFGANLTPTYIAVILYLRFGSFKFILSIKLPQFNHIRSQRAITSDGDFIYNDFTFYLNNYTTS